MRLTKLNTGIEILTHYNRQKKVYQFVVSYPDDKYLKYIHQFNYDTKGKEVN